MRWFPWKTLVVVIAAACALAYSFPYLVASTALAWLFAHGKTSGCDWGSALSSYNTTYEENERGARLLGAMRSVERDGQGLELWNTPNGPVWCPVGSAKAIAQDLAEQNRGIYDQSGAGARRGDIVLDVGANVGLYTRSALKAGASLVVAIEPVPANVECLRRNLKTDIEAGRVLVIEKGAWDKDDFLEMNIDPENMAADSFVISPAGAKHQLRLPLTTLDRIATEASLPRVDFIKMDIEGAERQAVAGAATLIRRYKPRLALCVYHLPDDPVVLPRLVTSLRADYRQSCGSCFYGFFTVHPQVYFFQ